MDSRNSTFSASNVLRLAVGGAIGGIIAFYLLDPGMRVLDNNRDQDAGSGLYFGAIIGASIGVMLILAEEVQAPKPLRLTRNLLIGAIVGSLIGTIGAFVANMVFNPFARTGVQALIVIGRVAGWAIMGASAGLCPGVVAGSMVRIRQGVLGGILGGAVGGLLFDLIAMMTRTGSLSRMVGFTITGLAIGIAVGLIAEFKKVYWLTVLSGGREGRSYTLTRPSTVLGRDELVDIPLFGDISILKQHASIVLAPTGATLVARPGAPALVNGAAMPQIALQDGDVLEFGRHRLRFHQRYEAGSAPLMVPTDPRTTMPQVQPNFGQTPSAGFTASVSRVTVVQGPHLGSVFVLSHNAIIGRDDRCDIPLVADTHLSRQHARFVLEGTSWVVEDGNSTNGTYANGVRVARHLLAAGDQISLGQTIFQVS